ncbi:hypothetical protein COOONC_03609 [Cooperia oncophora]
MISDREHHAHERTKELLQSKTNEAAHVSASLHRALENTKELANERDELKRSFDQLQERNARMECEFTDKIAKLKRRHADELKSAENLLELERGAHEKTKVQFSNYRDAIQVTLEQRLAELEDSFTSKERRLTTDMSDKEHKINQLQEENEKLLERCSRLAEVEELLAQNNVELEKTKRELNLLRSAKDEGDRAITELAGHHNQKQKINYLEKVRLENYNLKKKSAELEAQLKRYEAIHGKLNETKQARAGPSTRSRSARANLN